MTSYFKPIYSTNQLLKDRDNYQIISNDNFKKSFDNDPYIINNIYNQMDNRKYNLNKNYSPFIEEYNKKQNIEFFDNQDNISNYKNNFSDIHNKQNNLSMVDYQFEQLKYNNPGNPTALNNKPKNINNKSYLEDNIINDYSPINNTHMIYDINRESIDKPDESIEDKNKLAERMVHNNMVPFFSEKQAGESIDNYERYGNITTRKMDQFTGSLNDEMYRPKTERRPLFNPMVGLTNVYGSPVKTSEFEGRYVPSKERRNEKPFQEVRVTPGLNLPYHAVSNVGFHDPYRILPKNIDELRTLDNPQISYSPPVKWGQVSTERAARPNVNVYKPPTFVENERLPEYIKGRVKQCLDPGARERLPTKAYYDKEKIRDNFDVRNLATDNRGVNSTDWVGPINYNVTKESVIGKVNINRQNFEHPGPSNIGIDDTNRSYVLNRIGLVPSLTNRNIYNQEESGNIGTSTSDKLYTYDKSGIKPGITNRNIYNQEESGNIGTSNSDKLYTYDKSGIKPGITNRNIYNQEESGNIGTSNYNKLYTYDKSGIKPGITNRNIYNQEELGNIGTSTSNKSYTYDKSGIKPGITNRNIYNYTDHNGVAPVSIVKQMSRESANNMYINQGKDNLTIIHHSPTPVKYYKTPSNDNKVLRMCNKIQVNRDLYPDIKQQLVIGTEPLQNDVSINQWYTRPKQSIDSTEWRFLLPIKENLQGNPYINNLLYKSENVLKNDIRPLPNIQQQIQNLAAIYNIDNYK